MPRPGAAYHASVAGRPARYHCPAITAARRGGGGVPDTGSASAAVRPARAGAFSQLTGHLTQEGDGWAVRGLAGTLGTSDLRGDIFLERQEKRPLVRAALFSRHLDGRDLQALGGAAAPAPPTAATTPGGRRPARVSASSRADAGGRCPAALRGPDGAAGPSNPAHGVHGSRTA